MFQIKSLIAKILRKTLKEEGINLTEEEIEKLLETPPPSQLGDYAFPCFFLAEKLKKEPKEIALELRKKIGDIPKEIDDIKVSDAYLNFFINRKKFAESLIKEVLNKKEKFGNYVGKKEKVMIEFSQPNTHKAFHVGHIRGTSLGESIARVLEFCNNKILRANYQGDTGMHVAKWIWAYKKYHAREKIKKDESWIASIYVDAIKKLAMNAELQKEVEEVNKKLETGKDKGLVQLWKKTKKISLESFEKIYRQLNTRFDIYFFESEMEKGGKNIAEELLKKKIAKISDGAVIIDLKKYNLGVWVLLRKDGTVLYSAKDLSLVEYKFSKYKINRSIYVIGISQSLHMAQLFKTLELAGFHHLKNCIFIPFSEVRLPTGKMSSRTGENILYSDFLKEIIKYAKEEISQREPKLEKKELEKRALKISIGAIKYYMLKQNPNKNIIFNPKESINFEGDTGTYILYSYVRALSILKKSKKKIKKKIEIENIEPLEFELLKKISQFPEIVSVANRNLNPSIIANYSYSLSKLFNEFYHSCLVIGSEKEEFRLLLVEAVKYVLKNSLWLLGIETLEKM